VVNSERGRQLVTAECHVPFDFVSLVPNGLNLDRVRQGVPGSFRGQFGIPRDVPLVAYVGRNAKVKNIPRLLAVVRRVLSEQTSVHFVIAGEGLDDTIVAGTALERERRLHCVGAVDDVPSLLCDTSVLLLTSDSEGLPNVVLEAMAVGVPIVAPAVGDLPGAVPSSCGILVPPDVDKLANAVVKSLATKVSSNCTRLAPEHIARTWSTETMAKRTIAVWRGALAGTLRNGLESSANRLDLVP
jgi:glycosyltransferase involved in cell wall biosynthesis